MTEPHMILLITFAFEALLYSIIKYTVICRGRWELILPETQFCYCLPNPRPSYPVVYNLGVNGVDLFPKTQFYYWLCMY